MDLKCQVMPLVEICSMSLVENHSPIPWGAKVPSLVFKNEPLFFPLARLITPCRGASELRRSPCVRVSGLGD